MKWIDATSKLPPTADERTSEVVLILSKDGRMAMGYFSYVSTIWYDLNQDDQRAEDVAHWLPLPSPDLDMNFIELTDGDIESLSIAMSDCLQPDHPAIIAARAKLGG